MASNMASHCFGLVAFFLLSVTAYGQLSLNFYAGTCPSLEGIIKTQVSSALSEKRMGASLLRLFFHDCFVQGCDASVLLDNMTNSERDASPNANSLRGFNVIDNIKTQVELACPATVSCADILALATREAVFKLGGPTWTLLLGRRDSMTASKSLAETDLPRPGLSFSGLEAAFAKKGFNKSELTVLSGAHTIGLAQCGFADADQRRPECGPLGLNSSAMTGLDMLTPEAFDNNYYGNLMNRQGLLHSDNQLMTDNQLKKLVKTYSINAAAFANDFASAMKKLSELDVLTGGQGQIRLDCNKVN